MTWLLALWGWLFYRSNVAWRKFFVDSLTTLIFDVLRFRRYSLLRNLHIAFPHQDLESIRAIARSSVWNTIYNFFEVLSLYWWHTGDLKNVEIRGLENYLKHSDQGVLGLSLHMGNGDAGCAFLAASKYPVVLISKKFGAEVFNRFWFGVRERMGTRFIDPHNPRNAFEILGALKNKSLVIFVMDQFMGKPYGIETHFFGRRTGTSQGLAVFQLKTKLPVLPMWSYRDDNLKTYIEFGEPLVIDTENDLALGRDEFIKKQTDRYNQIIQDLIQRRPEQWMWIHRRWKKWE